MKAPFKAGDKVCYKPEDKIGSETMIVLDCLRSHQAEKKYKDFGLADADNEWIVIYKLKDNGKVDEWDYCSSVISTDLLNSPLYKALK